MGGQGTVVNGKWLMGDGKGEVQQKAPRGGRHNATFRLGPVRRCSGHAGDATSQRRGWWGIRLRQGCGGQGGPYM
jgi:hypothetical protein